MAFYVAAQVLRRASGRRNRAGQAVMPSSGINVLTRAGSRKVTSAPAKKKLTPRISAAGEGREDCPRIRECKASAASTAMLRMAGARRRSHRELAERAATRVERTMAEARRRLGVRLSQDFLRT